MLKIYSASHATLISFKPIIYLDGPVCPMSQNDLNSNTYIPLPLDPATELDELVLVSDVTPSYNAGVNPMAVTSYFNALMTGVQNLSDGEDFQTRSAEGWILMGAISSLANESWLVVPAMTTSYVGDVMDDAAPPTSNILYKNLNSNRARLKSKTPQTSYEMRLDVYNVKATEGENQSRIDLFSPDGSKNSVYPEKGHSVIHVSDLKEGEYKVQLVAGPLLSRDSNKLGKDSLDNFRTEVSVRRIEAPTTAQGKDGFNDGNKGDDSSNQGEEEEETKLTI